MASINISNQPELVTNSVQQRQEIYYLLTIDKINSIKSKSVFSDIFMSLCSLSWGAFLSCVITICTLPETKDITDPMHIIIAKLKIINICFFCCSILFTLLAVWTYWLSYKEIEGITSGDVVLNNESN